MNVFVYIIHARVLLCICKYTHACIFLRTFVYFVYILKILSFKVYEYACNIFKIYTVCVCVCIYIFIIIYTVHIHILCQQKLAFNHLTALIHCPSKKSNLDLTEQIGKIHPLYNYCMDDYYVPKEWGQLTTWIYWMTRLFQQWIFSSLMTRTCSKMTMPGFIGLKLWKSGSGRMRHHFHTCIGHLGVQSKTLTPLSIFGMCWRRLLHHQYKILVKN